MSTNPYAAPEAPLSVVSVPDVIPQLWNPNAAANWSLLFSPAFGAYLHMKNWQALGDEQRARVNRNWAISSIIILFSSALLGALMPESKALDGSTRLLGIALLVSWYMTSARAQAKYVKAQFETSYRRRGWGLPILSAIGCFMAIVLVAVAVATIAGP